MDRMKPDRKIGFYEKYIKRLLDILLSLAIIICFGWLFIIIAILVRIKMGKPIIFKQLRPGIIDTKTGKEKIFEMYKFRTMTSECDKNGVLLPDNKRLPLFGKALRATSLDELPEVFNILSGEMSFVGPRPQLVRDMVFMSDKVRLRHTAKPGLSGLAQVNGRNAITWEQKFAWDLKYIENISFFEDAKIVFLTLKKVFGRDKNTNETEVTDDYGDWLLKRQKISKVKYDDMQAYAEQLLKKYRESR